ncbi:tRNA (adenosine(37)-N6)-threonylcarbamoyltransferase complex ATPase subunit type 1 TsaE [Roseivirga pacifica]|uniref:tRNA (adenosine(37)-N6)-threonylcarbamoyltransferase complex ATPase subunit type 1 TsaE n=1 Tax=Roseivirga pacifica TaxID=1267423 RepID=UPI0020959188|nr:tRNA (adenosine(37)-N6)-threonylcarbamoyltransferase complex ATPase subunit type 1 TsaE [Roseivirga pacifica]MCO6360293.1 tRNA (adenosine(37)-N6)-threonylcarbamoyltransferase complex ATPase subunit type 1 TsaE [Roseivirga pacifica]MCO6367664.1 tRNA (adenosine(37)-N6)-threonylcarbamoyltransferase complex ATPase subunit type 1 TsaE [Roseivirga pacifica]MCO6369804.1 tRNA (adenosine(37)-N6)-threonylcarbamoyltransferase complex ATPase subunit type 1 TsaE [Roseivirga pacifica]MCO6375321.1 tRNA (ad
MVKELTLQSKGLNDLPEVAERIIDFGQNVTVWLFIGEMGAGKTTLIKTLCEKLQVLDQVSSPTFSIVNEYLTAKDETVYHFDFYRLEDAEEAVAIGAEDYFFSGNLCLIEWPQIIANLLPDEYMLVQIEALEDGVRSIKLKNNG